MQNWKNECFIYINSSIHYPSSEVYQKTLEVEIKARSLHVRSVNHWIPFKLLLQLFSELCICLEHVQKCFPSERTMLHSLSSRFQREDLCTSTPSGAAYCHSL